MILQCTSKILLMANPTGSFGSTPAPLMYLAKYEQRKWQKGAIQTFTDLLLSPFAMCFHYGQTVFEGLKAFKNPTQQAAVFRHADNFDRINASLERMAMPPIPRSNWDEGILSLVADLKDVVPSFGYGALYLRPFVIATQAKLGVEASNEYLFLVVAGPVQSYYPHPLKVKVERHYTRATPGGVGYAKCGGNYGGSLLPFRKAKEEGFDQILWTDAKDHEWFEESGTMNVGFIINGQFISPAPSDTILDGITRRSVVQIAKDLDISVEETPFSVSALRDAFKQGQRVEAFGIGTAAGIAPFKEISIDGELFACHHTEDALMYQLKRNLLDIQMGVVEDRHHWNTPIIERKLSVA